MRLLLLRHGQTHSNVSGALDTGLPGADLTDLGRAQAQAAGEVLSERSIDAIYCSTLVRTQQTAAPLAERLGLRPTILEGLRELSAGDLEMRTDTDSGLAYQDVLVKWLLEGDLEARLPGGESADNFLSRFDTAVEEIRAAGHRTVLVVSHGAAIRTWVGLRHAAEPADRWQQQATERLHNTGCIELTLEESVGEASWQVVAWHNHPVGGHLLEDDSAPDPTADAPA
jgi:probable phosphoglycerate mutase